MQPMGRRAMDKDAEPFIVMPRAPRPKPSPQPMKTRVTITSYKFYVALVGLLVVAGSVGLIIGANFFCVCY